MLFVPVTRKHRKIIRGQVGLNHVEVVAANVLRDVVKHILTDYRFIHAASDEDLRSSR